MQKQEQKLHQIPCALYEPTLSESIGTADEPFTSQNRVQKYNNLFTNQKNWKRLE